MKKYQFVGTSRDLNPGLIVELDMGSRPVAFRAMVASCDMKKWTEHYMPKRFVNRIKTDSHMFESRKAQAKGGKKYYMLTREELGKRITHVWS